MLTSNDIGVPVLRTEDARRRRIILPLVVLAAVGVIALALAANGDGRSSVVGAGSTLARPLLEQASLAYRDAEFADDPKRPEKTGRDWALSGATIEYEPVGSLGGVMRLREHDVDFAVADYPSSSNVLSEIGAKQFPIAIGAIAVVHNLDLPADRPLRLDAPVLARIYRGEITRWNDPVIAALNPGLGLPGLRITPIHRSDGSGSTYGITSYMAAGSSDWADGPGSGPKIEWPTGAGAERSRGMIEQVRGMEGAIGYAEPRQATTAGLEVAALANGAGAYTSPTPEAVDAAVADVDWSGDFVERIPAATDAADYPVAVGIYALIGAEASQRDRALGFLSYIVEDYDVKRLGFRPLPSDARRSVRAYWKDNFDFNPATD